MTAMRQLIVGEHMIYIGIQRGNMPLRMDWRIGSDPGGGPALQRIRYGVSASCHARNTSEYIPQFRGMKPIVATTLAR